LTEPGAAAVGGRQSLITPAFVSLAAATLVFFVAGGIVLPIVPQFGQRQLRLSPAEVGIAIAMFSVASLVVRPVVGWATDRFGRRPNLIGGAAVTVLALVLHLAAGSLGLLVLARALFGVGEAFFFVAALAAASDLAPAERRGEALSFFSLSLYLGLAIGPLIGEAVLGIGSYGAVWLVAAGTAAIALALAWLMPETVPTTRRDSAERARFFHPAGVVPGILIFLGVFGMAGFLAFVPVYVDDVGLSASVPLGIYAGIVVVLRLVGARLPDRLGAVRLSGSALVATAAGLAIIGSVPTAIGLIVGTAIMAVGVAFTFPALMALAVSRVAPDERGTVVGTASLFLDLAFGAAPVVLGSIAGATGYGPTFLVSAALAALGCALLVGGRRVIDPAGYGSGAVA
jgi:predicted MFS family arabinose efflux permease